MDSDDFAENSVVPNQTPLWIFEPINAYISWMNLSKFN